jgi:hypothetical protein
LYFIFTRIGGRGAAVLYTVAWEEVNRWRRKQGNVHLKFQVLTVASIQMVFWDTLGNPGVAI